MRQLNGTSYRASRLVVSDVFWGEAQLQPHRSLYWLNAEPEDREVLETQVKKVCKLYQSAASLVDDNIHLVSTDEMTGIQALERLHPDQSMKPGQPRRLEYEYERHGTLSLIANWHVALGEVISPSIGPTRKEFDFATQPKLERTNAIVRQQTGRWHSRQNKFAKVWEQKEGTAGATH